METAAFSGLRLQQVLRRKLPLISRTFLNKVILIKQLLVDRFSRKPNALAHRDCKFFIIERGSCIQATRW
jgi:hypothetical protein